MFEDCIGLCYSHYCSSYFRISNTPITMEILQNCLSTILSGTGTISLTLTFWEFIFNFDVRCVSQKFTTLFMPPPTPKIITDAVHLISKYCVRRI